MKHERPPLAIFDLDNTLLAGDSDYAWCEFLAEKGLLGENGLERNQKFFSDYNAGILDMEDWLHFSLAPLARIPIQKLLEYRSVFMEQKICPMFQSAARDLLARHRNAGHPLLIISATNSFVAEPIAKRFDVDAILSTQVELQEGRYTGGFSGVPCFREGKLQHLQEWTSAQGYSLKGSFGYSDSRNDIPLLEAVSRAHAVDPDPQLHKHATEKGWKILSLRDTAAKNAPDTVPSSASA